MSIRSNRAPCGEARSTALKARITVLELEKISYPTQSRWQNWGAERRSDLFAQAHAIIKSMAKLMLEWDGGFQQAETCLARTLPFGYGPAQCPWSYRSGSALIWGGLLWKPGGHKETDPFPLINSKHTSSGTTQPFHLPLPPFPPPHPSLEACGQEIA